MSHFIFKDISTNSGVQRIYFLLNNINQYYGSLEKAELQKLQSTLYNAQKKHTNHLPCYFQRENILPY